MITMEKVCKSYKVAKRNAGLKEACKSLFRREIENIRALSDVSFAIQDGEMVGYIGPNGAGKSSTIKILSGILTPDSGSWIFYRRCTMRKYYSFFKVRFQTGLQYRMASIAALTTQWTPAL